MDNDFFEVSFFRNGKTKYNKIEYEDDMEQWIQIRRDNMCRWQEQVVFSFSAAKVSWDPWWERIAISFTDRVAKPIPAGSHLFGLCPNASQLLEWLDQLRSLHGSIFSRPVSEMDAARELICRCTKSSD